MPDMEDEILPESKKEMLRTSPAEAEEMQRLIAKGLKAHNTVGALTFIGLVVVVLAALYYNSFDSLIDTEGDGTFAEYLDTNVKAQFDADRAMFGARTAGKYPDWHLKLYFKIRKDIYLLAGAALLLALIFIFIERAKMGRNDILVYRAMAREIEKLRLRIKLLEGGRRSGGSRPDGDDRTPTTPAAPDGTN